MTEQEIIREILQAEHRAAFTVLYAHEKEVEGVSLMITATAFLLRNQMKTASEMFGKSYEGQLEIVMGILNKEEE